MSTLTKFDPTLTLGGIRNLNFDPTVKIGWNQCHCENYKISFPTTIHWSKLELQRLKYPENRERHISMLPKAITFYPTIGFLISLVLWKLDIQSFLETPKSAQFESGKTFKYASEVEPKKDKTANVSKGWSAAIRGASEAKGSIFHYKSF